MSKLTAYVHQYAFLNLKNADVQNSFLCEDGAIKEWICLKKLLQGLYFILKDLEIWITHKVLSFRVLQQRKHVFSLIYIAHACSKLD